MPTNPEATRGLELKGKTVFQEYQRRGRHAEQAHTPGFPATRDRKIGLINEHQMLFFLGLGGKKTNNTE